MASDDRKPKGPNNLARFLILAGVLLGCYLAYRGLRSSVTKEGNLRQDGGSSEQEAETVAYQDIHEREEQNDDTDSDVTENDDDGDDGEEEEDDEDAEIDDVDVGEEDHDMYTENDDDEDIPRDDI